MASHRQVQVLVPLTVSADRARGPGLVSDQADNEGILDDER